MAESKGAASRPLSPHLAIYRPQINMVMSIVHRMTGAALYVGTLLLAWWLISIAVSERYYNFVSSVLGHPIGLLILVGYTWALMHHMLGGIRHLYWDTGRGFALSSINRLSWLTIVGSLALTAVIWAVGLKFRGMM
jgi:succinate dehydrogenase / fumarate reductase, cytochrome b subunit